MREPQNSLKRPVASQKSSFSDSFEDEQIEWDTSETPAGEEQPTTSGWSGGPALFSTASNKKIPVKESSLDAMRKKMRLDDDMGSYSQWVTQNDTSNTNGEILPPPRIVSSFRTAGLKPIAVSDAAMKRAREIVDSADDDVGLSIPKVNGLRNTGNKGGFVSPLLTTQKGAEIEKKPLSDSFDDDFSPDDFSPCNNPPSTSTWSGGVALFSTASNKEIPVKKESLEAMTKKIKEDDISSFSQWVQQDVSNTEGSNGVVLPVLPPSRRPYSFQTAGCKPIAVSEAAMKRARELVQSAEEDSENLALNNRLSIIPPATPVPMVTPGNKRGFLSPLVTSGNSRTPGNSSLLQGERAGLRRDSGFKTPMRRASFQSPRRQESGVRREENGKKAPEALDLTPKSRKSVGGLPGRGISEPATPGPTIPAVTPATPETPSVSIARTLATTSIGTPGSPFFFPPAVFIPLSQLAEIGSQTIDVIGVVDDVPKKQTLKSGLVQISFLLKDDSGGSTVRCDVFRRSDPGPLNQGDVVQLRCVSCKKIQGKTTVNAVVKSGLEINPECQEAERMRSFLRGDTIEKPISPIELPPLPKVDNFSYSDLKCVERLKPTDTEIVVKGHLHEIRKDSMTYLGCVSCKRKIKPCDVNEDITCLRCNSFEIRHFFAVRVQVFDFSGILNVTIFDEVFSRLMEEDADEIARLQKYNPDQLNEKIFAVEFSKPRLFRLRRLNDDWQVVDFKELDYASFNEYLGRTIQKKGYPIPKPLSS